MFRAILLASTVLLAPSLAFGQTTATVQIGTSAQPQNITVQDRTGQKVPIGTLNSVTHSWLPLGTPAPASGAGGSNQQIQVNGSGSLQGVPGFTWDGSNLTFPSGTAIHNSLMPEAPNNSFLAAVPHTAYAYLLRTGFTSRGDTPPLPYLPSSSPCSLNAGAGDGGAQVPTNDGGCWNAVFPAEYSPSWWGVVCDGSTPDTTDAGKMETYVESLNGGTIVWPAKSCVLTLIIAGNNITHRGTRSSEGAGGTRFIAPSLTASAVSVGAVSGVSLKDITVTSASQQTSGDLIYANGGNEINLDDVFVYHGFNNIHWNNVGGPARIRGGQSVDFSHDALLITGTGGGGNDWYVSDWVVNEDDNTYTPNAGVELSQGGFLSFGGTVDILHAHIGLLIDPAGSGYVDWIYGDKLALDSCDWAGAGTGGIGYDVVPTGGATVNGGSFANLWTSSCTEGIFVHPDSTSIVSGLKITNIEALHNLNRGVYLLGAGSSNNANDIMILGGVIAGNSQSGTGSYPGIEIGTKVDHVTINGVRNGATVEGYGATQSYALKIDSGFAGHFSAASEDWLGNLDGALLDNANLGTDITFSQVKGINPRGQAIVSPSGSPWTYTAGPTAETLYLIGTGITAAYASGGNICAAVTICTIRLAPNQPVNIIYSSITGSTVNEE